ncbi:hypothetical protein ACAW46_24290, partial [Escherichia coli]
LPVPGMRQRMAAGEKQKIIRKNCLLPKMPAMQVRQCGEVALPVPGMRQRMAAGEKQKIIRKNCLLPKMPAMQV